MPENVFALPTTFRFDPCFGSEVPTRYSAEVVADAVEHTKEILIESDVAVPEFEVLQRISMAATEAVFLLFQAADHEPSKAELEVFFSDFVLSAITGEDRSA